MPNALMFRGLPPPGGLRCRLRSRGLINTFSGRRARYAPDRSSCEPLGSSSAALSSNATMGWIVALPPHAAGLDTQVILRVGTKVLGIQVTPSARCARTLWLTSI